MKKLIAIGLAIMLLALGAGTAVFAAGDDQIPSANAAFAMADGDIAAMTDAESSATEAVIMRTQVKTGTPKDLVIDVSAETFLGTTARLDGTDATSSEAGVEIRVLVDGQPAAPGWVTFDNRLLALQGDLTHNITYSEETGDLGIEIDDHWIEVFIDTSAAHAFNFLASNVGSGVHDIVVEARLTSDGYNVGKKGDSFATYAGIGNASAVVTEVMLKYVNN